MVSDGALMHNGKRLSIGTSPGGKGRRLRLKSDEDLEAETEKGEAWVEDRVTTLGCMVRGNTT